MIKQELVYYMSLFVLEFGEMMMMQNAQMHQMVMQKLMLGQLPGGSPGVPHEGYWHGHHDGYFHGPFHGHRGCCTPHGSCHGGCHGDCHGDCHCHVCFCTINYDIILSLRNCKKYFQTFLSIRL